MIHNATENRFNLRLNVKLWHILEALIIPYSIYILSQGAMVGRFAGIVLDDLLAYYGIIIVVGLIILGLGYAKLGKHDYRLWVTFHFIITIHIIALAAMIVTHLSIEGIAFNFDTVMPILMATLIIIGAILSIFGLSDKYLRDFEAVKKRITKNDFSARLDNTDIMTDSVFGPIADMVNEIMDSLVSVIDTVKGSANQVGTSSEEFAATAEEVNALSEEIAATIQQVNMGASHQSDIASLAIEDIKNMSNVVDTALEKIGSTLQVIEDIAEQTNILALNAAIEAARAGEFGRGFAVVADNVRRLAEETRTNSADISQITEEIISNIGGSVSKLQETLQSFAAQSEEFSASSEEVAAATEEQTAVMHQMTNSSQNLMKMSEALTSLVSQFKLEN
ncbi:MAG: methyl-accepting chemotaxis protein [Candidatus Hodarchaeota archaeon]